MRRLALIPILLGAAMLPASAQQLMWQGEVNGPTQLIIRGDRVDVDGYGRVDRMDYRFYEPLPQERATVGVTVRQGRGTVRVLEQPRRNNDFTTVISVDPQGRRQFMVLDFTWQSRRGRQGGGVFRNDDYGTGTRNRSMDYQSGSMTWSGRVDQEAIIEVRGRRVAERTVRGRPVYTGQVNFSAALPRADVNVQLTDARGRGRIDVVEQPSSMNNYTARVRVVDEATGAGEYSFVLAWGEGGQSGGIFPGSTSGDYTSGGGTEPGIFDNSGGYTAGDYSGTGNRMVWSGRVDGRIRVIVQGNRSWVETLSGAPPRDVRVSFGAPLPSRSMNVDIDRQRGRDEVRLIDAPSPSNGYRAVFEIHDESSGYDYYEVELKW